MIDSVSVEQFDWSAESKVLIPAEHLWSDFSIYIAFKHEISQLPSLAGVQPQVFFVCWLIEAFL